MRDGTIGIGGRSCAPSVGGVSPGEVFGTYLSLALAAFVFGSIGILCSASIRSTAAVTVATYAAVILLFVGKETVVSSIWFKDSGVHALAFPLNGLILIALGLLLGGAASMLTLRRSSPATTLPCLARCSRYCTRS